MGCAVPSARSAILRASDDWDPCGPLATDWDRALAMNDRIRPHHGAPSGPFTSDFRHEFEAETTHLLRERFLWFNALVGGLWTVMLIFGLKGMGEDLLNGPGLGWGNWNIRRIQESFADPVFELAAVGAYVACFVAVLRGSVRDRDLLRLSYWLIVIDGGLRIVMKALGISGGAGLWGVGFAHVLACVFLPWSPRQAVGPILPLLALSAGATALGAGSWTAKLVWIALSPLAGAPGFLIAYLKHSRRVEDYKTRFLQKRYGELRRELVDARRIHEALFPSPRTSGPVRFEYRYEPMRQIGGDYLYASVANGRGTGGDPGQLSVVVMDVTGHGIPAALTVNRLHGELERVFAENPDVAPGEVLKLLNRYVHLTLASHSVYVTALCVRVDCARDEIEYASGGHPPAFLRAVDGTIHELPSTAFVLGACADADFKADPASLRMVPGDSLIAYTDGAIEARDARGRMLGVQGFSRLIASTRPEPGAGWSETLLRAVDAHRYGPPADDTLVIEVSRPV